MRLIRLIIIILILSPCLIYAEKEGIEIGDPRELFLTEKPQKSSMKTTENRRTEPMSLSEVFANVKKGIGQVCKELREVRNELEKREKHCYRDPNFTPPPRPDWR